MSAGKAWKRDGVPPVDWANVDWAKDDNTLAEELNRRPLTVRHWRGKFDANYIENRAKRVRASAPINWMHDIDWKKSDEELAEETGYKLCTVRKKRTIFDRNAPLPDTTRYSRRCHDCGAPTNNYRCQTCLTKWRIKHCVSSSPVDDDMVAIAV